MASHRLLLNVVVVSVLAQMSHGCSEVELKHKVMMCQRAREYKLQLIVDGNSENKNSEICCAGYQFMDCVMEVVDANCTDAALVFVSPDMLFINNTFCLALSRDSCVEDNCHEKEFNEVAAFCRNRYNDKVIHIMEDPMILNKSAALCCALAVNGRCLLNAMVDKACEGRPLDLKQAQGLTDTYGQCDIYNYLDCNAAQNLLSSRKFIFLVLGTLLVNKFVF